MKRTVLLAVVALALVAGPAGAGPNMVVGVAEDGVVTPDPAASASQFQLATALGLRAVRITAPWSPGQTAPDPAQLPALTTAAQQSALLGVRLFLEVYPASAAAVPADDAARAQFAEYLRQLALALPQVKDFVVGSQVNNPAFWPQDAKSAASYLALLAVSYDTLKSVDPTIDVIAASLSSQGTPGTWVLSLGQAYRKSGRALPVMDALAIQPQNDAAAQPPSFVHPKGPIDVGDYARLVANLKRAFDKTAQPGAALPIVYDGYGVQTQIPPEKASLYTGAETDAVDEATQGAFYAQALQLAACQPNVTAFLFLHTVDEGDLAGLQTGLYYRDATPKSDVGAVQSAIAAVGSTCPAPAPAPTPTPTPAPGPGPAQLQLSVDGPTATLGCDRPCYYVAVLEDDRGVPLRARQGAVAAGPATSVTVPTTGLPAGSYSVSVHLVPRVDPGHGEAVDGDPFSL